MNTGAATRPTSPAHARTREAGRDADVRSGDVRGRSARSASAPGHVQSGDVAQARCRFPRRDGQRCRSFAIGTDHGCLVHSQDPALVDARTLGSYRGGLGRSSIRRAAKIVGAGPFADVAELLERSIREVHDGKLNAQAGHSLAALARSLVAVHDSAIVADRLAELESEVAALSTGELGETFRPAPGRPSPEEKS